MEALSYTLAGDGTLHVHVDGVSRAVRPDVEHYEDVMAAVREKEWDKVASLLNPLKDIEEADDRFEVVHGVVVLTDDDGEQFDVPTVLGEEIQRYAELGLDLDRLILFAKNLNLNPSYHSVQQLYSWIKTTNLTLTEDGHFIAYKGIREDWTDCHTGKMLNTIGTVVNMKRNQVDEDPGSSCSRGLHVATYDYAHNHYGGGANRVVAVKVHPRDVVAVPNGEFEKMRTCEYLVLEESAGEIKSPTYEDRYNPDHSFDPVDEDPDETDDEDDVEEVCEDCGMYESDCFCEEVDEEDEED